VPEARLVAALKHLRYEIRMFKATAQLLMRGGLPEGEHRNAVLESFTIHARILLQFFHPYGLGSDEMIAADYFRDPVEWKRARGRLPDALAAVRNRVGKEIAHLTYDRVDISDEAKRWSLADMHTAVSTLIDRFIETVEPRYRAALLEGMDDAAVRTIFVLPPRTGATFVTHVNTPAVGGHYSVKRTKTES
jgi:hypothetical protein